MSPVQPNQSFSIENAAAPVCENCGTTVAGAYCGACGQAQSSPIVSVRAFATQVMDDVARLDSRLLRTVRALLLQPGHLTREFLDGRRVRYTQPVPLYLAAAALFFLVASYRPFVWVDTERLKVVGELPGMVVSSEVVRRRLLELPPHPLAHSLFAERFASAVNGFLPAFLIGSVILFSFALYVAHRNAERRYLPHAIFALHWTAFFLLLLASARLLPRAWGMEQLVLLPAIAYLTLALRRVYGQTIARSVGKAVLLLVAYLLLLATWVQSAIVVGLRAV
jgi:hypothetical protein